MAQDIGVLQDRVTSLERELAVLRLRVQGLSDRAAAMPGGGRAEPEPRPATEPDEQPAIRATERPEGPEASSTRVLPPPRVASRVSMPAHPRPASREQTGRRDGSLERRIGGQAFAIVGALIVIVGFALLARVAVDHGWFRVVPPWGRCLGLAAAGLGLLALAEWLRARVRPIAVAGCNAAGLGGVYVASFASFGVFGLVSPPVAFTLMAMTAALGFGIAFRHRFLSTGALSLLGAYLVPLLLFQPDPNPAVLPVYLLLLSATALGLATARPRPLARLRELAWVGSGALGLLWTAGEAGETPWLVVSFWAALWMLHQGELLLGAARGEGAAGVGRSGAFRRIAPGLLSVVGTAVGVTVGALVLDIETGAAHWLAPASACAATGLCALTFGGRLRVLRDAPRTALESLAAVHAATAGALLIATIALAFGGWVEVAAWLAMGVGAVVAARWIDARSLGLFGGLLLAIATLRLVLYDAFIGPASVPWTAGGPLAISPGSVLLVAAGASWMVVATLLLAVPADDDGHPSGTPQRTAALWAAAIAVGVWLLGPVHPEASATAVALVWLGLSVLLRFASPLEPRLGLERLSVWAAAAAVGPWVLAADLATWMGTPGLPGVHVGLWLALAIASVLGLHAWRTRDSRSAARWLEISRGATLLALLLAFVATSFEVARVSALLADDLTARRAAVSIWWGLWGLGVVVAGFWRGAGPVRSVGLGLMSIAAAKAIVLDLTGVPPLWRVASFLALGAGMLGVAVLYGRVSAAIPTRFPE